MTVELAAATAIKLLASLCGAAIGLALMAPTSIGEFWRRLVLSVLCGMSLWPVTYMGATGNSWIKLDASPDVYFMSIVITAALSWWVLGAAVRIASAWKGPGEKKG